MIIFKDESKYFIKVTKCPLCDESVRLVSEFNIHYFSSEIPELIKINEVPNITLTRCKKCNHCFSSHIIKPEILNEYYSNLSSVIYQNQGEDLIDTHERERKCYVKRIEKLFPKGGKILDIGCGYGFMLSYFDKVKWDCYGIEPSVSVSEVAEKKGIKILSQYIDQLPSTLFLFDVIVLFDVIEHLPYPQQMILKIRELLKEGGILILATGDIDSLNAKLVGFKWSYFNTYEHISFFNKKSIRTFLQRNKFNQIKIKRISYDRGLVKNSYRFLKNFVRYILFKKLKIRELNQSPLAFDHMLVFARK